ncbi:MAG TPA: hypothetical protein VFW59_04270 [Gallionella sp.]|nr:hypothetical protein [Gallionella sp.]
MSKQIVLPTWLSVLSLAVALFVPCGVGLIADASADFGNRENIVQAKGGRFVPPDEWLMVPVEPAVYQMEQSRSGEEREPAHLEHRV